MSRDESLKTLNGYYEEISSLNRKIEAEMRDESPNTDLISTLLSRKDFLISMCVKVKEKLEDNVSEGKISDEETQNNLLLEQLLEEDKLNRELTVKAMARIKTEIVKLKGGRSAAKLYQKREHRYGSINKKG